MGRDAGRDTDRVKREAVEKGGLGRKVGLGKQCLSFDIIFLAIPFLLLLSLPHLLFLLILPVSLHVSLPASLPISLLVSLLHRNT
jgi:hypothetical protein